jgi:Flp pilus assembly pilin Flp
MDFLKRLRTLVRSDEGQDLLEYALLVALIAMVAIGAVALAGSNVSQFFSNASTQIPAGT